MKLATLLGSNICTGSTVYQNNKTARQYKKEPKMVETEGPGTLFAVARLRFQYLNGFGFRSWCASIHSRIRLHFVHCTADDEFHFMFVFHSKRFPYDQQQIPDPHHTVYGCAGAID